MEPMRRTVVIILLLVALAGCVTVHPEPSRKPTSTPSPPGHRAGAGKESPSETGTSRPRRSHPAAPRPGAPSRTAPPPAARPSAAPAGEPGAREQAPAQRPAPERQPPRRPGPSAPSGDPSVRPAELCRWGREAGMRGDIMSVCRHAWGH
ncbi:hypothetical protein [Streptomyces sp. NHF165]|uniref:hypothetical protein n=1 Tax=Streptomyces sp. NHF165 TaxID=2175864 RepID=UPI0013593936|nr:hypothetical protein [Streptomyces sp. NHF165]